MLVEQNVVLLILDKNLALVSTQQHGLLYSVVYFPLLLAVWEMYIDLK